MGLPDSMPSKTLPSPVALHHRDFGGAGEPPYVILHGMLGSSRNWMTAGRSLAANRRVYALDLRNHGLSPHSDEMTYEAMVGDVGAWLDAQGIASAELVGHSMGGKVAMLLACRMPGRVGRLVVVDIAPKDYHRPENREEFTAMRELDLSNLASRQEADARMESRVADWAMRKFILTNLERLPPNGWKWQVNLEGIAAALPTLERNPLEPGESFGGPALFIAGGKSRYIKAADHAAITHAFPAARITVLPECGHNPHIEAREAFVAAVNSAP
jgi:esterase